MSDCKIPPAVPTKSDGSRPNGPAGAATPGLHSDPGANGAARIDALAAVVGGSSAMQRVRDFIGRAAAVPSTVLLLGQTGTGKELVARAIHGASPRRSRAFVVVNCAGVTESLVESAFFGHRRGSFTGALTDQRGLAHAADGGSLFLDEIGDASSELQAQLLRVLEDGEIRPIGAIDTVKVDVRVIAATHRDLGRLRDAGSFREDLYYRLSVLEMHLPALNARREDIPALADHFLSCASVRLGRPGGRLTPAALAALVRHDYRGNLRELRNLIERAIALAVPGESITEAHLFGTASDAPNGGWRPLPDEVHIYTRSLIRCALDRHDGNRSAAARDLGVSRRWLLQLLKRYGIAGEDAG